MKKGYSLIHSLFQILFTHMFNPDEYEKEVFTYHNAWLKPASF